MRILRFTCILLLLTVRSFAQEVITVPLTQLGRDERFDKFMLTMPVFVVEKDTVLTMDFENLRPAKKIRIKKPGGYNAYGYSYIFFNGNNNTANPGYVNLLIGGLYSQSPHLYVDRNNNFDFTDDGERYVLPARKEDSLSFPIYRNDDSLASITLKLKKLDFSTQPAYRKLMSDYYAFFYKDRTFAGIDVCYREQRYITKYGIVHIDNDSFKLALYDGNSNALYNEADSDRVITANYADSTFDSRDELRSFVISKKTMYVEYHGVQFEVVEIDRAGNFIKLKRLNENLLLGKIKEGDKIPKFKFITWNGAIGKIKKYRRFHTYLYFTGPHVKNFSNDTAMLRKIADAYPDQLKVIAFIDVNKSYELKIFGTYSNLNYVAAYKDKEMIRKLAIRGLPSSIWLGKKRKVIQYNIKPEDFLRVYDEGMKKKK